MDPDPSLYLLTRQVADLEKELADLKSPSAESVSKVLESYQNQVKPSHAGN